MRDNDVLQNNSNISRSALEAIHDQVFGWALSRCDHERAVAEDLVQQAYVELLTGKAKFEGRSSLKTFVFSVVQNLARGRFRRVASRLRPAMGSLQTLFEDGNAAFVANLGPLVEPTTKTQYQNQSVILPPQLFSHNDQQSQWHSLKGAGTSKTGWAGRIADLIQSEVLDQKMAINASLEGTSLFQSAQNTIAYVMGQNGPLQFDGFSDDPASILFDQKMAFQGVLDAQYGSIYERGYAGIQKRALQAADTVSTAISNAENSGIITTVFPTTPLGRQLSTVAKLIASRAELGMRRQIFFVGIGGFDSHDDQNQDQLQLLGGAVNGRDIYGSFPVLEIGGAEDVGGGRMIPSTSADQYAATLAKWFGIPDVDLDIVAPNLSNFAQRDLGFMIT